MPRDARALADALRELSDDAAQRGGRAAAVAMAREGSREIARQLDQRQHARGTPSPSPAGQPPARITGALRRSLVATLPRPAGTHRWQVRVGPTAPYGRIQELGGRTGRRRATTLPPRPYMLPAVLLLNRTGRHQRAAEEAFRRELRL